MGAMTTWLEKPAGRRCRGAKGKTGSDGVDERGCVPPLRAWMRLFSCQSQPQPHCQRQRPGGGVRQEVDLFFGDRHLLCSFLWGSRRPTSSNLLPPGPPPFIFSPIPACLFGVGLKGAGWTRTENDISTRTT